MIGNLYIFYLDDESLSSGTLKSYEDPNTYATMGTSPADPTPTVTIYAKMSGD